MHRLKLTWLGNEGNPGRSAATFRVLAIIAAVYFCTNWGLYLAFYFLAIFGDLEGNQEEMYTAIILLYLRPVLIIALLILFVALAARTRGRIRSRYGIPERDCRGCEDCCCAFWCGCCTVSQMARHTADYENYAALCCSETGLSPNAPSIV